MVQNLEIRRLYLAGDRQFINLRLRHAQLRHLKLSDANFQGSDLSYANLKNTDLSRANLSNAYFNEANLMGCNLYGAILTRTSLIKANLIGANLVGARLHDAFLTKANLMNVNFSKADLSGAYLNSADVTGANFTGAIYTQKTQFPEKFDPTTWGMVKKSSVDSLIQQKVTVTQLLYSFNQIAECSIHYLGPTITAKYLKSSRPAREWLTHFQIDSLSKITFDGSLEILVTTLQMEYFKEWITAFIKTCSLIIQDFQRVIKQKEISLINTILDN